MDPDKMYRFCFVFCLYFVIFVCIYNNTYTFLLVLIFSPKLFERWIKADQQHDSGKPTLEQTIAKARKVVDRLDHVTFNIAVTGETGAGKSSFVNAIRGLQDTDEGAAPTGPTETIMEPTMYPRPNMPNVKIWVLPGIGGNSFKAETYMNAVKYQTYDFFIIVSASRFTENYMMLANEIKKNEKKFYFVRSKTDNDVANEKKTKNVGEEKTLEKIRKACLETPSTLGSPPVFLISSHYAERFDFQKLVKQMGDDDKKYAMITSLSSLFEKYSEFKKVAWALAFTSGAIAAIPVPGLATACDVAIAVSFLTKVYYSFGLDDGSLQKLLDRGEKPMLEKVKKSGLVREIAISTSFAKSIAVRFWAAGAIKSLCILVPGAGNIAAAAASVATTQAVLQEGVTELYKVAKIVLELAEML